MPRTFEEPPPRRPAYFWWLLANALALCFAVVSWFACLSVFQSPENPRNYEILRKLGRLPVLKRYTVQDVPNGNSRDPRELYKRGMHFSADERKGMNTLLLRNYVTNFDKPLLLTYAEGDYRIEDVRKLGPADFFSPGVVVRAQAMVKPDDFTRPMPYPVVIEYLFPTADPRAAFAFKPGDMMPVRKNPNCAAILHIGKVLRGDEPAVLLTVVPIAYEPYKSASGVTFGIEPPARLRPGAKFPVSGL